MQHDAVASATPAPATKNSLAWYLVHTKPRQEQVALVNLMRQGYTCYLPKMRVQRLRRRQVECVHEPMFPRYLFIQLDSSDSGKSWVPIRSTLGVRQLVYFGARPAAVDQGLIDILLEREAARPDTPIFVPGDTVRIVDGPLAGLEAVFKLTDAEQRSIVLLEIVNRMVSVRVKTASLRKSA
jgi:transcriptional antiterminator RfaH